MKKISDKSFVATFDSPFDTLVTFVDDMTDQYCDDRGECKNHETIHVTTSTGGKADAKLMPWGKMNNAPQERENLILDNNIVGPLISIKRNFTAGSDIVGYRELKDQDGIKREMVDLPTKIQDWIFESDFNKTIVQAAGELYKHANIFTEFLPNKNGEIVSLKTLECKYMRATEKNKKGKVTQYLWSGAWSDDIKNQDSFQVVQIPAYNSELNSFKKKFVYHTGDSILNDGYYCIPLWWGGRKWIVLANCIPEFHLANLKHGYSLRYHVSMPESYFYDLKKLDGQPTDEEWKQITKDAEQRKEEFKDNLNEVLAGQKNAGRSLITTFKVNNEEGKSLPGVELKPISAELYDEKLLSLFEKSNTANISAQGIHPTLANIETQGKLSSGSEIRNALIAYLATQNIPRKILLEPLEIVRRINKWDEIDGFDRSIKFGFKDTLITTLDEDKSGKTEKI